MVWRKNGKTQTYVSTVDEGFDECFHVLKLLSRLQQEHNVSGLLTRHCAKNSRVNTDW